MAERIKQNRVCYSIDWLQLTCVCPGGIPPANDEYVSPDSDSSGAHRWYTLRDGSYYIKGYNYQKEVMCSGYVVAHIACLPRSEHMPFDAAAIKLENSVLYLSDWYFCLSDLLKAISWQPRKLSRVDLAADFNFFLNGLCPDAFLRAYVRKQDASYLRIGSNKFCLYGVKDMHSLSYDSIRWGSRKNGVSVYMYNKSKELREVKNKPYIREAWKKADLSSTRDVWRVEISLTSAGMGLKNLTNDMIQNLFVDDLKGANACRDIFKVYGAKYFRFVKTQRGAKSKRDLKEVKLLDFATDCALRPCTQVCSLDSGRMEKIISRRLLQMKTYVMTHEFKDRIMMLDALNKVIELFNQHYQIKDTLTFQEEVLTQELQQAISSVFHLPTEEAEFYALRDARKRLSEWKAVAVEIAKAIVQHISSAHAASPPPRAAARNGFFAPTLTNIPFPSPDITPEFVSQFVGQFFKDDDFADIPGEDEER